MSEVRCVYYKRCEEAPLCGGAMIHDPSGCEPCPRHKGEQVCQPVGTEYKDYALALRSKTEAEYLLKRALDVFRAFDYDCALADGIERYLKDSKVI